MEWDDELFSQVTVSQTVSDVYSAFSIQYLIDMRSLLSMWQDVVKHYLGTILFTESSINLTASDFLLESKMYKISAKAALCIKESANNRETI